MNGKGISSGVGLSASVQSCNRIKPVLMTLDMIKDQLDRYGSDEGLNLKNHVTFRDSGLTRRVVKTSLMLMDTLEQGRIINVNNERAVAIQDWVV